MATKATSQDATINIAEVTEGKIVFCLLGTSPLISNRVNNKASRELLYPGARKTAADKAAHAKHDPIQEFRDSPYRMRDPKAPTVLAVPPSWFKQGMCSAALDTPGAKKAQIGRLVTTPWDLMPVYGRPQLFMAVVRSADMNKTPDIRTRAILPEWACRLEVTFQKPILRDQSVINLLAAAGRLSGCGDWRQQKGSGSFGAYKIVPESDKEFQRVLKLGRSEQQDALDDPVPYDEDTAQLLSWFVAEAKVRGQKVTA